MRNWILAIRPKTLIAGISPVILGTLAAPEKNLWIFLATLCFALSIQIGTNLANDYYDFFKGADTPQRKGPLRVTQAGIFSPKKVKFAFLTFFSLAFLIASFFFQRGGIFIPTMLSFSLFFGLAYTAGPIPLGYIGMGDLLVFLFFGPLASMGSYYLQMGTLELFPFLIGIGPGLISTALLAVNNTRDVKEDQKAGKKTLVVRFGEKFGKGEYFFLMTASTLLPLFFLGVFPISFLILLLLTSNSLALGRQFWKETNPYKMNAFLASTTNFLWIYTFIFSLLLWH